MHKRVPGNNSLKISLNGKLIKNSGEECTLPVVDGKIEVQMYGQHRWVCPMWLGLVAHFEVDLPVEFGDKLFEISFQKCRDDIFRSPSGMIMEFKRPMVINRKYRIIPGFTRYAISCDGELLDIKAWKLTKLLCHKSTIYPKYSVYNPDKSIHHEVLVHRLVALAWVPNHSHLEKPIVNHIDGNKGNFHYKNLEWVTYSENSVHAVQSGLRPDAIGCKVRNAETGMVSTFSSARNACDFMGIDPSTKIARLIRKTKHRLIEEKFEVKLLNDTSPWFYEQFESGTVSGRYTVIITKPDGSVEIHPDKRKFQKDFKIWNISNVEHMCSKFREAYPMHKIAIVDNYSEGAIEAYEVETGEITSADNIRQLSKIIGVDFNAIRTSLLVGETRVTRGYAFRYKTDTQWNTNFTEYKSKPLCILATHRKTGEVKNFKSLREAAKFFMRDRSFIKNCLSKGWSYGQWTLSES